MALELKKFQRDTLDALQRYLEESRIQSVEMAFQRCAMPVDGRVPAYRKIKGLERTPYLCLRVPTGGGKTILAAYSIERAAKAWLEVDFPVVLWLVPTNTIRSQTLDALTDTSHPYRQALDDAFAGKIAVFDIGKVEQIRPKDLAERVCVVVGTLSTLRVTDTEGRRIYDHNENFEPHFAGVRENAPGLEQQDDGPQKGKIKFSFANVLHLNKPLVIMDEAHNARTKLTFEVLQRVSPACILEFTATPDTDEETGSNVLYRVSASELKAAEMIKLPIMLTEHTTWQQAVQGAVATRQKLADTAKKDSQLIRPLVLFQAENRDETVTVDVLRRHLIENEKIAPETIAVATGSQRELDGINLFDPLCKIEFIITVQALKEGWDCSFAYVFCTVASIRASRDVEQLLGRVLRMPFAKRRSEETLNRAYAQVCSPCFAEAAKSLHDRLVNEMGFEDDEAKQAIQQEHPNLTPEEAAPLFRRTALKVTVAESPDLSALTIEERATVTVREVAPGKVEVTVTGDVPASLETSLVVAVPAKQRHELRSLIATHRETVNRQRSPSEKGEQLVLPRLCVLVQGELEIAEKELFLEASGWNLLDYPAEFPEFMFNETARTFEFDLKDRRVVWTLVDENQQMDFTHFRTPWHDTDLVQWLDRQVRQDSVRQEIMLEFVRRSVAYLMQERRLDLATLVRAKFILAKALEEKVRHYRAQAYALGYQETLFGPSAAVETSFDFSFRFDPLVYPARWFYKPGYRFQKHYYPLPGELDNEGEEFDCAFAIDRLPQIKYWVRNLELQPDNSFWLPTSSDRFYPDFVGLLQDDRLLVVEYKGKAYATNDDSKEKKLLGQLWESRSKGAALFLMAEKRDNDGRDIYQQLEQKIRKT
jgi:type III restriction enzyme